MKNPKFTAILAQLAELHDRKNADYARDGSAYSNFEQAAVTAGVSVDTVFAVLLGIKLARLAALAGNGRDPLHESVQDTRIDLANYAALWASYHVTAEEPAMVQSSHSGCTVEVLAGESFSDALGRHKRGCWNSRSQTP